MPSQPTPCPLVPRIYLLGEPAILLVASGKYPSTLVPGLLTTASPFTSSPTASHPTHRSSYNVYIDDINNCTSRPRLAHSPWWCHLLLLHTRVFLPSNNVTVSPASALSGGVADSLPSRSLSHQGYFFWRSCRCAPWSLPHQVHLASLSNILPIHTVDPVEGWDG